MHPFSTEEKDFKNTGEEDMRNSIWYMTVEHTLVFNREAELNLFLMSMPPEVIWEYGWELLLIHEKMNYTKLFETKKLARGRMNSRKIYKHTKQ